MKMKLPRCKLLKGCGGAILRAIFSVFWVWFSAQMVATSDDKWFWYTIFVIHSILLILNTFCIARQIAENKNIATRS
jgi:hypothetical protein